jgi:hypothetical protein
MTAPQPLLSFWAKAPNSVLAFNALRQVRPGARRGHNSRSFTSQPSRLTLVMAGE